MDLLLLERKGLSQQQIAKKLGISRNTVKKYMENQGYPEERKTIQRKGQHVSAFNGSAETFYCFAYIIKDIDTAYIVFANCGSEQADTGVRKLLAFLIKNFNG